MIESGPLAEKITRATGLGRRTRVEIGKGIPTTALRLQRKGENQTAHEQVCWSALWV